jgi:hypothetical protein
MKSIENLRKKAKDSREKNVELKQFWEKAKKKSNDKSRIRSNKSTV